MNKDFLRRLQLFADLPETDLDWLSGQAEAFALEQGGLLIEEGAPGEAAYILLEGELEVTKKSDQQNFRIAVREPGEVIGEMALLDQSPRTASVRAMRPSRLVRISGETFQRLLAQKPSAVLAILHTVTRRLRQNEAMLRQSEKMVALGTMAAGLAHELNNPAAAIRRSVDQLRLALGEWRRASIELDRFTFDPEQIQVISGLHAEIEKRFGQEQALDPLARSDRESGVQAWLEQKGLTEQAWELAPTLVSSGWEPARLQELASRLPPEALPAVIKWLAAGCAVYSLLGEAHLSAERISEVVRSVKAYSYLDQGAIQDVDVHEGLENTLVILRHKLKDGVQITRDYAADLPRIEAHGSELNQVWTNLIDNAVDAMQGHGELTLRTFPQPGQIVVEIEDNGPGIPPEIQSRIYEPFFTTKPPGIGTGLGLHIAYTIVNNHHGQIRLSSRPGMTRFQVSLPLLLPR